MQYKRPGTHGFGARSRLSNIKIIEKPEIVQQRYIVLSCVLIKNAIIWSYWERIHVLLLTALVSRSVRFMIIIPVPVLHVRLLTDWLFFECVFVCCLFFLQCTSADMANKRVHTYIGWQWRNFVLYLCQLVFTAILWVKLWEMFLTLMSLK